MANSNTRKILALRNENVTSIESPEVKPKEVISEAKLKELKEIGRKAANFDEDLLTFNFNKTSEERGYGVEWVLSNRNAETMKERTTIAISAKASATLKKLADFSENLTPSLIIDNILLEWVTKNMFEIKRIESKNVKKGYF